MISQAREQRNASFSSSIRMKESPDSSVGAEMINSSQNLLFPSRPRAAAAAILKGAAQHKTRPKQQQQLLERASYLKGVQRRERRLLKNARIFNIGDLPSEGDHFLSFLLLSASIQIRNFPLGASVDLLFCV
jgi:hypothetical protein